MLIYRALQEESDSDSEVLDVGTKHGRHLEDVAGRVVALDLKLEPELGGINYVLGDGYALPFPDETFDYVVCNQVLEHIEQKDQLLDEIRRVISSDGIVFVSFPNRLFPANPHHLPPLFSLLPRRFGVPLSRLLGSDRHRYYRDHVFNLSPIRARSLLSARFGHVEYMTHEYIHRYPEVYEGSSAGRFLLSVRSLIGSLTRTTPGAIAFELAFGYAAYRCSPA